MRAGAWYGLLHMRALDSPSLRSYVPASPHSQLYVRFTVLYLVITHPPSQDTLAKAARTLHRLQYLRVTLVPSLQENPLPLCAATIAYTLPRLHAFSITFIPPDFPLPLYFGSEIGRVNGDPSHPYTETGNYVVKTDEHGLPTSVACTEHRNSRALLSWLRTFPASSMISRISFPNLLRKANPKVKKYSYTLDLYSSGKKRCGLGLVFERSTAGEETRVLVVLMSLTGLALWGFFS